MASIVPINKEKQLVPQEATFERECESPHYFLNNNITITVSYTHLTLPTNREV